MKVFALLLIVAFSIWPNTSYAKSDVKQIMIDQRDGFANKRATDATKYGTNGSATKDVKSPAPHKKKTPK